MISEPLFLVGLAVATVAAGLVCLYAIFRSPPWLVLPPQRWRATPWGAGFCLAVFLLLMVPQYFVAGLLMPDRLPSEPMDETRKLELIPVIITASIIIFPLQLIFLRLMVRRLIGQAGNLHFGSLRAIGRDVALGAASWLVMTPVVLGIQLLLGLLIHWFYEKTPDKNILIEAIQKRDSDQILWILITIKAVLMAPLREEIVFRGFLQPWLARQQWGGIIGVTLALLAPAVLIAGMPLARIGACVCFIAIMAFLSMIGENQVLALTHQASWLFPRLARTANAADRRSRNVYRSIVGTSLLFAVFHASSWPDPVPLFVFSLVVGWLAWRTQGIVASIVVHSLFNATALWLLRIAPQLEATTKL